MLKTILSMILFFYLFMVLLFFLMIIFNKSEATLTNRETGKEEKVTGIKRICLAFILCLIWPVTVHRRK